jgi:hypothetical protein
MKKKIQLDAVYAKSDEVVAREIKGQIVIVPMAKGIGDMEDELYTLNETGRDLWDRLDGKTATGDIVAAFEEDYDAKKEVIRDEVTALMEELIKRKMLVKVASGD